MILRYGIAIVTGVAVTFGLLFLMQFLIAQGKTGLDESATGHIVDFVRVKRDESLEVKKQKPKKPPTPDQPPPDMPEPDRDALDPGVDTIAVNVGNVPVSADLDIGGVGMVASDGDYLPIVKVAPVYPRRALARGLEGYVIVEFTVTNSGTVRDPIVVESSSPLFEKAALQAALKFKYKPRVVDGNAIEVAGVRNKITFQLEDG